MIKRRYYRAEHADKDNNGSSQSSSSSSSDSDADIRSSDESQPEPEPNLSEHKEEEDDDVNSSPLRAHQPSSSSGYESEDSSANEIDADLSELPDNDNSESGKDGDKHIGSLFSRKETDEIAEMQSKDRPVMENLPTCVLKSKSVYKCRLCPKIVCLNEESLKAHLESKRHSRSEKLLNDGRLKRILNSDGEEEVITDDDDGETHAERHARILALAQDTSKKKGKGRQRQRLRLKRKKQNNPSNIPSSGQKTENRAKRRRKNVD